VERLRSALRHAALGLVVLATGVAVAMPRTDGSPVAAEERPVIVDDDGGRPMFTVPALAPGDAFTRCIRLDYSGGGARVRLSADAGGTGLAAGLLLTIEHGSGGGYGSCRGFRGSPVYDGTVGDLAAGGGFGVHDATPGDRSTYRFTVTAADDVQQQRTATAAFTWEATETSGTAPPGPARDDPAPGTPEPDEPAATAPPASSPAATPDSGTRPSAGDAGGRRADGERGGRADGTGRAKPDPGRAPGGADGSPGRSGGDGGGFTEALRDALRKLASVASEGAKRGAFPLLLLLLMIGFVLVQHLIDGRDPKLALAPMHVDPDLPFADYESGPITIRSGPSP
jgi:hypothetical protein